MQTHLSDSFHIMAKPTGAICNLDCEYCFYLEKEKLYPSVKNWAMPDDVLEKYIKEYIQSQKVPEIIFAKCEIKFTQILLCLEMRANFRY